MPDPVITVDPTKIVYTQGGLLIVDSTTGSGTGNYDSFLRIQANNDETGYNTEEPHQLENKDGIWTHDLLISDLQVVTYNGQSYYEIRLDLNEVQSGSSANITLDDLQLFVGDAAGADFYPTFDGRTPAFDLTSPVPLVDNENGSGTDDYQILIPVGTLAGGDYLTLYADFSGSSDGFEEFRARTTEFSPQPDIGILKETEGKDDECANLITGGTVHWTYTVENNGNVPLSDVVVMDDNGTPGFTDDDFEVDGVLKVDGIHNVGDDNNDGILDTTETWSFAASGTVQAGEYENTATVSGVYDNGTLTGLTVTGIEEDCYYGVTPTIEIVKYTNGHDDLCDEILVGQSVVWTYEVTNTSADGITIGNVVVTDDAGTVDPVTGDDFHPSPVVGGNPLYNIGDTHNLGILDNDETWYYTATLTGGAVAGEYENTATVTGTASDTALVPNTAPVTASETDCYFGAAPEIELTKLTNGTNDLCPVVSVGSTVTWTYNVFNSGNVALTNIQLVDDNGTPGGNDGPGGDPLDDDDFVPTAVLGLDGYNVGDSSHDGIFDAGETWVYEATGIAEDGHYDNFAYVSADYTDDLGHSTTVNASEDDCYVGVEGPGVRTPGFWSNPRNGGEFWNGQFNDEKHAGDDCFPLTELTRTDTNGNGQLDSGDAQNSIVRGGKPGLLIGDWNMDGDGNDPGEDTIFISLEAANILINASQKEQQDGRYVVGRDLVAAWLNYLAGNPIGVIAVETPVDHYSPMEAIQDAINFLQQYGDTGNDGIFKSGKVVGWEGSVVKQGKPEWTNVGSLIHGALDEYNNTGGIDGIGYAHSCDQQQFVSNMTAFMTDHGLFSM